MAWEPYYNAVQEEGVIDNVKTIVKRDFKDALDVFYPIEAALLETDSRFLRDFQERSLGQVSGSVFPSLALAPNRNASTESENQDRLNEAILFDSWIGVTDDSAEHVTRRIMRYAGTYNAVLRTAAAKNKADFFRNMSTEVWGVNLELEHIYGPIGQKQSQFFRSVVIQGTLKIFER